MARKNRIQESIDRATESANREIIASAIADLPASKTTIKDLHAAMSKSTLRSTFESMTLADLREALGAVTGSTPTSSRKADRPQASGKQAVGRKINTRTASGRAALDTAVRDFLRENGASRSEHITPNVPGDTAQVRQALKRMIEAGEVVVKGERRASEYNLTKKSAEAGPGGARKKKTARKRATKK